jgi:hypothetical protein
MAEIISPIGVRRRPDLGLPKNPTSAFTVIENAAL